MSILCVSRWSEVFETAESRRHRTLIWIAVPVSFNSTGLQRLLDEFEPVKAAALYGCWNALLKVAATAPQRGVLAGQKGESYSAGRLARLSGFPRELFEELIPWCVEVGWLVDAQATTGLPDLTGPDLTKPDRTGPDTTRPVPDRSGPGVEIFQSQPEESQPEGKAAEVAHLEAATPKPATGDRQRVRLTDLLPQSELLQRLDGLLVTPGTPIVGPVVSPDRLRREEIDRASTEFWFSWYRDQLASRSPLLRAGNMAEAVYVLAAVLAVKKLKGIENRMALLIKWLKDRDATSISAADFRAAAERISRLTGDSRLLPSAPSAAPESRASQSSASPDPTSPAAEPRVRWVPGTKTLTQRVRELRTVERQTVPE